MSCTFADTEVNTLVIYLECGKEKSLKLNEPIKCEKCGYRILYKKRRVIAESPILYEAI